MILTPEPLEPETFAPFGRVIDTEEGERRVVNQGHAVRYHRLAEVDAGAGGRAILSIFRARRWTGNALAMLERHPLAGQIFMPLAARDWLIVVAAGKAPTAADCRLFHCFGDQGVQLARGTWHHPLLVLVPAQDFLVIDREGPGNNLETIALDPPALLPPRLAGDGG